MTRMTLMRCSLRLRRRRASSMSATRTTQRGPTSRALRCAPSSTRSPSMSFVSSMRPTAATSSRTTIRMRSRSTSRRVTLGSRCCAASPRSTDSPGCVSAGWPLPPGSSTRRSASVDRSMSMRWRLPRRSRRSATPPRSSVVARRTPCAASRCVQSSRPPESPRRASQTFSPSPLRTRKQRQPL